MLEQPVTCLIHHTQESYGKSFNADLLEQFKLYVQSAENVSARRVASIQYLLTLNAALVTLYGLQSAGFDQNYGTLLIPIIGVLVSLIWLLIIKSHADLNRVKFDVIHEFEQHLPATPYKYEWLLAEEGQGIQSGDSNRTMDPRSVHCTSRNAGDHNRPENRWRIGLGEMKTSTDRRLPGRTQGRPELTQETP